MHRVDERRDQRGRPDETGPSSCIEEFAEPFERLLVYVWRRHLAAAVSRMEALSAREEDLHTLQLTVGFADIVGFTAMSNQLSEDEIGDLVELYEARCADVVAAHRGRVIKSIGDSVLFVHEDPVEAYEVAEGIITVVGRDARMPDVRVGLASGLVVVRLGDVFGPPVEHGLPDDRGRPPQPGDHRPGDRRHAAVRPVRDAATARPTRARIRDRRARRRTTTVTAQRGARKTARSVVSAHS